MCRKSIFILLLSLGLISTVYAGTVNWTFDNGDEGFTFWSAAGAVGGVDDPNTAGDESLTGVGGSYGLPGFGIAWSVGTPNEYDGLKPAVADNARVDANGLLDYSLGSQHIPADMSTLNTFALNEHGDHLNTAENDQGATSPMVVLGEHAVLSVWSLGGGGNSTHAPSYDSNPSNYYTDGSSGISVLSAEKADKWTLLASLHLANGGDLGEDTLDLSALAGKHVYFEAVDAFEGSWGWLAIDKIQITHATCKRAGFVLQYDSGTSGYMGIDEAQIDHLHSLGYDVKEINQNDVKSGAYTKADANGLDLLVVSESPSSSATVKLAGTSTPVMHEEAYGWKRQWAMSTGADGATWKTGAVVNVVDDTHPITMEAGLSAGPMDFYNPSEPNQWTVDTVEDLAPGAQSLVEFPEGGNDWAVIFAIDKGGELTNGQPATSRMVGFSLPGSFYVDPCVLTAQTWALYDASIDWLTAPSVALIVKPSDLSAGFDLAQYFRLISKGYAVTVVSQDEVGSTFTEADANGFDLLVISESLSSSATDPLIGTSTPVMHEESYGWDNWNATTQGTGAITWQLVSDVNIVADTVDANVPLGPMTYFDPNTGATTDLVSSLAPGADLMGKITVDSNDYAILFTIDQGAQLANDAGMAPARFAGFSLPGDSYHDSSQLTDDAWALWDATIQWLLQ